ncbi:hypothetical protein KKA00_05495 [bacterium]|nr:hypothetical protein [bacterium]MBU1651651.1 hypothetical protein [bacterium]MBU1880900.1 hypothetical protein [bacterium]
MAADNNCSCPEVEVKEIEWHNKDMDWSGKFFYFEDVRHAFNVPLGLEAKRTEMKQDIERKGYTMINPDLTLHESGMFTGRIFVEIENPEQLDANVIQFGDARILTRYYKGSAAGMKRALEELKTFTLDKTHILPRSIYIWHLTCPKCAGKRGGDKSILFAKV